MHYFPLAEKETYEISDGEMNYLGCIADLVVGNKGNPRIPKKYGTSVPSQIVLITSSPKTVHLAVPPVAKENVRVVKNRNMSSQKLNILS